MPAALDPRRRRALRARAHRLHPVVSIGQHGLTPPVLHEIDLALGAHELVKVRVFSDDRAAREALLERICSALACAPVQHLGKILIVWREKPKDETPVKRVETRPAVRGRQTPPRESQGRTHSASRGGRNRAQEFAPDQSRRRRSRRPDDPAPTNPRRRRRSGA